MKADSSRKKLFQEKAAKKKTLLNVHVSKSLKTRMKKKKRAILVKKGDRVKIMRGNSKGKEAKVVRVNYGKALVFLEGMTARNAKGKENMVPFQPSNLMLVDVEMSGSRKELFSEAKSSGAKETKEAKEATAPVAKAETKFEEK